MLHVQVVLSATMLRRTKNQTIKGKPLLVLPERIVEVVTCDFDPEEREFYNLLQERTATRLADIEAEGQLTGKRYTGGCKTLAPPDRNRKSQQIGRAHV